MAGISSLESLQLLHSDLLALSESRLYNVNRLWSQLESKIAEFKKLLDKAPRKEQSRTALTSGKITIQDVEYTINEEFQQNALQVSGDLDLDELEAAQLVLESTRDADVLGRSVAESAIINFHQKRQYLLDCYRLILHQSSNTGADDEESGAQTDAFGHLVQALLTADGEGVNGSKTLRKCFQHMADIRAWLSAIGDRLSGASVLGGAQALDVVESLDFQRTSLIQQHESLGLIVYHLIKGRHSNVSDFEHLVSTVKSIDKYDNLLVHHFPAIGVFITILGGAAEGTTLREARRLNDFLTTAGSDGWALHYVHAAVTAWWLAEYSGRYGEGSASSPLTGVDLIEENKTRTKQFYEALKDGAFDFLLSLSADVKPVDWLDPARHGLRQWLQRKAPALAADSLPFSNVFQETLMEQIEIFIDGFISNMPDVLRRLRTDEDEQRQLSQTHEHDLDLERFLVLISYSFENRPEAALSLFWTDTESNLAGFLAWASRRASTPLMSAFCEMLQSLSESDECASAAHEFLLEESSATAGKIRRSYSLTWSQIFRELKFFTERIQERAAVTQTTAHRTGKPDSGVTETEPESAMMLESYLRLITRLCTESNIPREFLLHHRDFHILDILYQLASSAIPSRLRACTFNTLRSLASRKSREEGDHIWNTLDVWISGGYSPTTSLNRGAVVASGSLRTMDGIFLEISTGFEEPDAFVQLLTTLLTPYEADSGLNDCLPFPESLGAANRMPGIEPYVDFAMRDVFAASNVESNGTQLRLVRLSCLNFIKTCLSTFNEDLVVFANRSNIPVDEAIAASNLSAYICLHPFARVMEWCFNDKVMAVMFDCIHQDPKEVAKSAPDSPLVLCLVQAVELVSLILDLQSTYLNIVRPTIKKQATHRRNVVANAAFASFEDGILNNIGIFVDLGLFVGVGHPVLTVVSLDLLQKLSAASKLTGTNAHTDPRHGDRNKVIAALEASNESDRISQALLNEMTSHTEIDVAMQTAASAVKLQVLDFLISCLQASRGRPSLTHLLLGLHCDANTVDVRYGSRFSRGDSIFHATVDFIEDGIFGNEIVGISSALTSLRNKGLRLLSMLWNSPLTSQIVMDELRHHSFLQCLIAKEVTLNAGTVWDGRMLSDPEFFTTSSCEALSNFLSCRCSVLRYAAAEMRLISQQQSPSLQKTMLKTLFGSTIVDDGQQIQHCSIFDLFDFMELDFESHTVAPNVSHFSDIDFSICIRSEEGQIGMYDLHWAQELVILRRSDLLKHGQLNSPQEEVAFDAEVQTLLHYLTMENQLGTLRLCLSDALDAWTQLMLIVTNLGGLDRNNQTEFVFRALQVILPKLEKFTTENVNEALELAKLAKLLLISLDFSSTTFQLVDVGDQAAERLFELFSLSLQAISSPIANAALKESLYCICYRYLNGMSDASKDVPTLRKHSIHTIKAAGERLLDVVCDDAYAGDSTCRISAILLLCAFVDLADRDNSKYIIESLMRLNCVTLMVDSLKDMSSDLEETSNNDLSVQIAYYHAKLALLVRVAQTRFGSGVVFNTGLFQAIKDSGVFAVDPDIGVEMNDKASVEKHYNLLLALMRVINTVVLSRGQENQQVMTQGRQFLSDNRPSIMAVFKRSANLLSTDNVVSADLIEDLTEAYMLLATMTNFLDFEEESSSRKRTITSFT